MHPHKYTVIVNVRRPDDVPDFTYWVHPRARVVQIKKPQPTGWKISTNTYEEILQRIATRPHKWRVLGAPPKDATYGVY